jgi:hypothetical protein
MISENHVQNSDKNDYQHHLSNTTQLIDLTNFRNELLEENNCTQDCHKFLESNDIYQDYFTVNNPTDLFISELNLY